MIDVPGRGSQCKTSSTRGPFEGSYGTRLFAESAPRFDVTDSPDNSEAPSVAAAGSSTSFFCSACADPPGSIPTSLVMPRGECPHLSPAPFVQCQFLVRALGPHTVPISLLSGIVLMSSTPHRSPAPRVQCHPSTERCLRTRPSSALVHVGEIVARVGEGVCDGDICSRVRACVLARRIPPSVPWWWLRL